MPQENLQNRYCTQNINSDMMMAYNKIPFFDLLLPYHCKETDLSLIRIIGAFKKWYLSDANNKGYCAPRNVKKKPMPC